MNLDLNDDIQRAIYFGMFERDELEFLRGCVGQGDVCIDAGANVGFYTCHLASWVGSLGHVHAFEPEPKNAERLAVNVRLNGFSPRVTIHPEALSFEKGHARFNRAASGRSGWGSFHRYEGHVETIEVETETVDGLMEEQGLDQIALLKVDVEGADFDVYRGASKTLEKRAARYVMAEWNGVWFPRQGRSFRDFTSHFAQYGYRPLLPERSVIDRYAGDEVEALGKIVNVVFGR